MSIGSLRMQTLNDHASMTDAIRLLITLQKNQHVFNPFSEFPFIAETMSNHLQQLQ
jgi:hypothetical protein